MYSDVQKVIHSLQLKKERLKGHSRVESYLFMVCGALLSRLGPNIPNYGYVCTKSNPKSSALHDVYNVVLIKCKGHPGVELYLF